MQTLIFAGKGGVGKSTTSVAAALALASDEKVLLIDHDGGHSLARVLAFEEGRIFQDNDINPTGIKNLYLAVVNEFPFNSISGKGREMGIQNYLAQFKNDYGLLAFLDMIASFFGAPTDIPSTSKFLSLVRLYNQAKIQGINHIVLDVEPTAGLERLLDGIGSVTRSLENLQKSGWLTIKTIGAKWPDIAEFMKGDYIKQADLFAKRMVETADLIREATYFIVTIPESSPVAQAGDVKRMINSFGGNVMAHVVNNIRHEPHEEEQIAKLMMHGVVIKVGHDRNLCDSNPRDRRRALRNVGHLILAD